MSEEFTHRPVLLDECIEGLNIRPDGVYVDGTLGRAGHSVEIVKRLTTGRTGGSGHAGYGTACGCIRHHASDSGTRL